MHFCVTDASNEISPFLLHLRFCALCSRVRKTAFLRVYDLNGEMERKREGERERERESNDACATVVKLYGQRESLK